MKSALPFNPNLDKVAVYVPGRPIEEVAREVGLPPGEIIKLASNENPLGPSPAAVAAMREVLDNLHLYPDGNAFYLKQRLAEKLGLEPGNLIFGNGSNEIIEFISHALMGPGVDLVVSQYCFAVYPMMAQLFGANLISVPAKNLGHDLPAMVAAITPQTRVIFVANPNNPTGTLASREDVMNLIEATPPAVMIAMDEAYIEFMDKPLDLVSLVREGQFPNLLLMRTFSKIFGLAGLRIGYGIGHPEVIAALEKVRQPFNVNAIAQAGALAALDDEEHLRRTRANNSTGLRYVAQSLRNISLETVPSAANFILARVGDGKQVSDSLQQRGVIVRPLGGYQLPEWIRITIGTPEENERCVAELKKVLAD